MYAYLVSLRSKGVLTGQQESTWMDSPEYEMNYLLENTGKLPAVRGFDYIGDDFDGVNARAAEWWKKGGLVTICWHTGSDFTAGWREALDTNIKDWDAALTEGTPEYDALIAGMDKAAEALNELKAQGIPVLWRPFHEFDGKWFWWGKDGADSFVKLWKIMYERYTDYWQLDNLIWVLGYSKRCLNCAKWYPGDAYCDVIGADSYSGGAQLKLYNRVASLSADGKPLCFHECGTNPTAEELKEVPWVWFMTWHTEYVTDENEPEELNALYNSDYVLTLDELSPLQ